MRIKALALALTVAAGMAPAQSSDTLAGIRADLAALSSEMQRLRDELSGGTSGVALTGSTLDRITVIESELQRLTGKTEELEFRLRRIVEDGTNRLGDLEFRICELEPNCDFGALGQTRPIGGEAAPTPAPAAPSGGPELAVGEQADFRRAREALANSDFRRAADLFAAFRTTYPGSPLEPEVLMGQGEALDALGDTREAARAYLAAYSSYPGHDTAPLALTRLGVALGGLGKVSEACVTLSEVEARYPGSAAVSEARDGMVALGCS